MKVIKRFLPWGVGLCFVTSSLYPIELETKLKSLKANLVQLKKGTEQLQKSLIKLKQRLGGGEGEGVKKGVEQGGATSRYSGSYEYEYHHRPEIIKSRSEKETLFMSEEERTQWRKQNKEGEHFFGLRPRDDRRTEFAAYVQYLLGPQSEEAREKFNEMFKQKTVDDHFLGQKEAFEAFEKMIQGLTGTYQDNAVPWFREIKLCCDDFIESIQTRYSDMKSFFGDTAVFTDEVIMPNRTYNATGPICPDSLYNPEKGTAAITKYEEAINLLKDKNLLAAYIEGNKWNVIRHLVDYFKTIKEEEKTHSEILGDVLSYMTWRTQGLVLAYILLSEGFADPEFLWWATGAILFYRGQGGVLEHDYKKLLKGTNVGYRQKQLADFACYQLLNTIKNKSGLGFDSVMNMCSNYVKGFADNITDQDQVISNWLPENTRAKRVDTREADINIQSIVQVAISGIEEKLCAVTFTGTIKCFGGGNGYTLYGVQAKADLLGMIRAQRLLAIVEPKLKPLQKDKEDEERAGKEAEERDKGTLTEVEKVTVFPGYRAIEEEAINFGGKVLKSSTLAGLVPTFKEIAKHMGKDSMGKDTIDIIRDVASEGQKSTYKKIDLLTHFSSMIVSYKTLKDDTNYQQLLMLCNVIVKNILNSKPSIDTLRSDLKGLDKIVAFIKFLIELDNNSFVAVDSYSIADRLKLDSIDSLLIGDVSVEGVGLFKLVVRLSLYVEGDEFQQALNDFIKAAQGATTGMGPKGQLIQAGFNQITKNIGDNKYSIDNRNAIKNGLETITNYITKGPAGDIIKKLEAGRIIV